MKPMQNRTIGILAHVDAGKTTLSEQILFQTGAVRSAGRVDHGDTVLDADAIERRRGITVFSDQAAFVHHGHPYTLIDTPGHVDFTAEVERSLDALDAAILLVDASEGVKPHTVLLSGMAQRRHVPMILFLNKCDLAGSDRKGTIEQAGDRLGVEIVPLPADPEQVAQLDEAFLETYLSGSADAESCMQALGRAFRDGMAMPVLSGSALNGQGIEDLLNALDDLLSCAPEGDPNHPLKARVYKIRRDSKGQRVTFLHVDDGMLRPRDSFSLGGNIEKIHEIRIYQGGRYSLADRAMPGDSIGGTGLSCLRCGDEIAQSGKDRILSERRRYEVQPALAAHVSAADDTTDSALMDALRMLEDEDDRLDVSYTPATKEILVRIMGPIQIEILEDLLRTRFGIRAEFSSPQVLYKETIAAPVMGYGHYEPLRHYAEVNLRLEPAPRGSGIQFTSECHVDDLPINYQNLIRTHVLERAYRGVLTGAELADARIVLTAVRAHEKHTEGGDFREATCRAIRQGLMSAQSILLEPFYRFEILAPAEFTGRILSDITMLSGTFESPEPLKSDVRIRGRGPVSCFSDYAVKLRAMTRGEGSVSFLMDGYDVCHDAQDVIAKCGYDPCADLDQPVGSVFCSHGAGFTVPWDEAPAHMHCLKK